MERVFDNSDFNSSDGMLTSVWGPSMWHFLHTMSFNYPINPTREEKKNCENFIFSLQKMLPCKYCRENFFNNLEKINYSKKVYKNRNTFSRFIYSLHEEVNRVLGKSSNLSYDDIRNRYEHFRARCLKENDNQYGGKIEKGCEDSFYGKKSKCVLSIVPKNSKIKSFKMSPKCVIKKLENRGY